VSGWQLKLCDPQLTRAISERFRDEVLYDKALYKSTLLFGARCPSVRPSVCLSGTGVHCDHTVHFIARILVYGLWLDVQRTWHPDTKACPPTPSRLFPVPHGIDVGHGCANLV